MTSDNNDRIASRTFPFKHTDSLGSQLCLWAWERGQAERLQGGPQLHTNPAPTTWFSTSQCLPNGCSLRVSPSFGHPACPLSLAQISRLICSIFFQPVTFPTINWQKWRRYSASPVENKCSFDERWKSVAAMAGWTIKAWPQVTTQGWCMIYSTVLSSRHCCSACVIIIVRE